MKWLIAVIAVLLPSLAFAGTVTLTGTCPMALNTASNSIFFNITNSGTDPAVNMVIYPSFTGFSTNTISRTIALLGPTDTMTETFHISNFSYNGTYAEAFLARYSQGSSTFYAVFPCPIAIGAALPPPAAIVSVSQGAGNELNITVVNQGNETIDATASAIAPPALQITPSNETLNLPGHSSKEATFTFTPPASGESLTTAMVLSYTIERTHFASMMNYVVSSSAASSGTAAAGLSDVLPVIFISAVVVVIIALIAFSIIGKRRNAKNRAI